MRIVLTVLLGLSVIPAALIIVCNRTAPAQQDARAHVLNAGILISGRPAATSRRNNIPWWGGL
jgi:hypothetical protein